MIDLEAGGNAKLGRLTDAEFRCHITGVLPLAAKSPIRGHLLVGEHKIEAKDVARQARMSVGVARKTLATLRQLGIIEVDPEYGCEIVHDFVEWNPAPKIDRTNAERQQRYRDRLKERNALLTAVSNGDVTPTKGREEKRPPVTPRDRGESGEEESRLIAFRRRPVPADRRDFAEAILAEFNRQAGTGYGAYTAEHKPSEDLKRILGAITDATPPLDDLDEAARIIRRRLAEPFWQGKPHTGVVFGPNVFAANRENAKDGGGRRSTETAALAAAHRTGGND